MTNPGFLSSCSADYLKIGFVIWLFKHPISVDLEVAKPILIFSEMNWEVGLLNGLPWGVLSLRKFCLKHIDRETLPS